MDSLSCTEQTQALEYHILEGCCCAPQVKAYLEGFVQQGLTLKKEIVVNLDNAGFHRAKLIKNELEDWQDKGLRLWFQPPYSPNLNLIERLWKFMRQKFCKDKYRSTFTQFKTQLDGFFAALDEYTSELATLLTEKFELLPSVWHAPDTP